MMSLLVGSHNVAGGGSDRIESSQTVVLAAALTGVGVPAARTDFSPAETKFLIDVRPLLSGYGDARAANLSDTDLVGEGWWAAHNLAIGIDPQQQGHQPAHRDLCATGSVSAGLRAPAIHGLKGLVTATKAGMLRELRMSELCFRAVLRPG